MRWLPRAGRLLWLSWLPRLLFGTLLAMELSQSELCLLWRGLLPASKPLRGCVLSDAAENADVDAWLRRVSPPAVPCSSVTGFVKRRATLVLCGMSASQKGPCELSRACEPSARPPPEACDGDLRAEGLPSRLPGAAGCVRGLKVALRSLLSTPREAATKDAASSTMSRSAELFEAKA